MIRSTQAIVDLDAIRFNIGQIRNLVGPSVKICPAVKANGYGHGAVQISRVLVESGVEMLAVALPQEAIELREAGITVPILNLGCVEEGQIPEIIDYDISATICTARFAGTLSQASLAAGKKTKVHIKLDTGMGRIGIQAHDALNFARTVAQMPGIEIEGVFMHFPTADDTDLTFAHQQVEEFNRITNLLTKEGIHIPIRHASNSAAILNLPEARFDMVRPGIIVYGLYDADTTTELHQAMTLKTRIAFLKEIPAGRTVSYGRTFTAKRPTLVATIPIGYGDGYSRALSNQGPALVRGKRVQIIGRVCMDQTMIDVTDVPNVQAGDEVVLFGKQGNEFISIREVAGMLNTITYEVTCMLGQRVPRVYEG